MEVALACLYFAILAIVIEVVTISVCARHSALWRWRTLLQLIALLWLGMAILKKGYIDEIHPPNDGLLHESVARDVADQLTSGRFAEAFSNFGAGNPAYQFALGVFYALTGAPEIVTYAINGAFAYWGLLTLLEICCRQTRCARLPASVVLTFSLLPSALLWTTTNLKEGPILWGICMMCYWTIPAGLSAHRAPRILPVLGLLMVMVMRPHIAIAWLLAIGAGMLVHTKRFGLFFVSAVGVATSIWLLSVLRPETFEAAVGDGAITTLTNRYDTLSGLDDTGRGPIFGNKPIPIVSGLILILFRPWPTEVNAIDAFLAGLEVWALVAFGLRNWTRARGRWRRYLHPALVSHVVLLVLMGFYFSYTYNMGLAVRHRLMCFPAVLSLYTWPLLAKQQVSIGVHHRLGRFQRNVVGCTGGSPRPIARSGADRARATC